MRIEHVALWTNDLDRSKEFYTKFFGATSCPKYVEEGKNYIVNIIRACYLDSNAKCEQPLSPAKLYYILRQEDTLLSAQTQPGFSSMETHSFYESH